MQMKATLKIIALMPVFLSLIIILAVFWAKREIRLSREMDRTADKMLENAFELNLTVDQYLLYPSERPKIQFRSIHGSQKRLLETIQAKTDEGREIIKRIRQNHESIGPLFNLLVKLHEAHGAAKGAPSAELRETAIGQLLALSREIVSDSFQLSRISEDRMDSVQGWSINFLLLLALTSGMGLAIFSYLIGKNIERANEELKREITERTRAEEALRQTKARYELLSDTAGRLLATDAPQGIVNELCRKVMAHLDCQAFFNFLVDDSAGRLRLNAYAGIPDQEARKIEWLDYGVAVCGCVAQGRACIIAEDILHTLDPRTELVKSYGIQAHCCHPLMAQGRLIGTLSFGTKTRAHFTSEEVELMRKVTDQVATAMERIQTQHSLKRHTMELQRLNETLEQRVRQRTAELTTLSSELLVAQEKERRRISYDLHDNVWQMLEVIRFDIERLFAEPQEMDPATLRKRANEIRSNIRNAVATIRSMQGDLWPSILDDIGILATITWYCREFEKNHLALSIERHTDLAEDEVPPSAKIVIYRVMQEALSNVIKYSQATRVSLFLNKKGHRIQFTVEDNGIGFDLEEIIVKRSPWGGLGLLSMKERTELSGGSFRVESSGEKGTIVCASWPIT